MPAPEDLVWSHLLADAERWRAEGPLGALVANRLVTCAGTLAEALSCLVTDALAEAWTRDAIVAITREAFADEALRHAAARDLLAAKARNSAFHDHLTVFAASKGFLALQAYRVAHRLRERGGRGESDVLHHRATIVTGADVSPGARIGAGLLLDHATGIVIGETALVEDEVAIWHGVTLGSTFTETVGTDRHPKIRRGAILTAGATILGNIEVGEGALVAAGSLVTSAVPPGVTVAGRPARIVSQHVNVSLVALEPDDFRSSRSEI